MKALILCLQIRKREGQRPGMMVDSDKKRSDNLQEFLETIVGFRDLFMIGMGRNVSVLGSLK